MITSLFIIIAAGVAVGGAFVLKRLEAQPPSEFRGSRDRLTKRQIHRIAEQLGQQSGR